MAASGRIDDVSDTSFWVAYYRAQESQRSDALFHDRLAEKLVGDHGRQIAESMGETSRYTAWSVVSRTVLIDRFIQKLIGEGVDAVINLGAGLDTRPYRMNLPADLPWIEVDYPHIVSHKNELLAGERPNCRLTRVELDLADVEQRRAFLASVVPEARRVLILTEGVIIYLSPEQVAELGRELHAQTRFAYWIAEYFNPQIYPYLQTPARRESMKRSPFRFFPDDWYGFFGELGWKERETGYSGDIAVEFRRPPPMPRWARWLMRFAPARARQRSLRMAGYVIFEPTR